jgi:hypothetical protein
VELVVALSASVMLVGGLASTVYLAGSAADLSAPSAQGLEAMDVAAEIADELRYATFLVERSDPAVEFTAVEFVVADRTGDGQADVIRYAWSGQPGDPLTRTLNHGTPQVVAADVYLFGLDYDAPAKTESFQSPDQESAESVFIEYSGANSPNDRAIKDKDWAGQYFHPNDFNPLLPNDAISWRVTKVEVVARSHGGVKGQSWVQLRPATGDNTPTSTVLEQVLMVEAALLDTYQVEQFAFSSASGLSPNEGFCLVIQWISDADSADVQYDDAGGSGVLATFDAGASWTYYAARSLRYRIYGTVTTPGPPHLVNRAYLTGAHVSLQVGESTHWQARTGAHVLNSPELLLGYWKADFDVDPTQLDHNADGQGDWTVRGGGSFDAATLTGGVWQADASILDTYPGSNFDRLTTVDLRFRDTAVGGTGAVFSINADRTGAGVAVVSAAVALEADGTQTLTVSQQIDQSTAVALFTLPGLPSEFVDLRLVIDPVDDVLAVWVDNVHQGSFYYAPSPSWNDDRFASVFESGSEAEFDYVAVRVSEGS